MFISQIASCDKGYCAPLFILQSDQKQYDSV